MNLFLKSYSAILVFFVFICCESGFNSGFAQDHTLHPKPWIQEINLPDHYIDIPNNSLHIDGHNHLFLGKQNGLSILYGDHSVHLHLKGPVHVYGKDSDSVYFSCQNDFGLVRKNVAGEFEIFSLKDRISKAYQDFTPSRLTGDGNRVFIDTDRGIYCFENGRMRIRPNQLENSELFMLGGQVMLLAEKEGFFNWKGGPILESDVEKDTWALMKEVHEIQARPQYRILAVSEKGEMVVHAANTGIQIRDHQGRIISQPAHSKGLPDRDIQQACFYGNDELWILGLHSLHNIKHPSALSVFDIDQELTGRIYAASVTERNIYLGSNQGVFLAHKKSGDLESWNIRDISRQAPGSYHLLDQWGEQIFAAGSNYLLSIRGTEAEVLDTGTFTGLVAISETEVLVSGEKGTRLFQKETENWISCSLADGYFFAHSLTLQGNKVAFICNNHIFQSEISSCKVRPISFEENELLLRLIPVDQELYLITSKQVYLFDSYAEAFLPLAEGDKARMLSVSDLLIKDNTGGYWMVQHGNEYMSRIIHSKPDSAFEIDQQSFPILQILGEVIDLHMNDNILYLAGMNKFSLFDLDAIDQKDPGNPIDIIQEEIPEGHHSARFRIRGIEFQSNPPPMFRHMLSEVHEGWSDWTMNRYVDLERLPPGNYELQAQVKDLYGTISEAEALSFTIIAPFYRTWYAYSIYILVFLFLLFLLRKWYMLSYQRAESRVSQRMETKLERLATEKAKTDQLVADILPLKTAAQLLTEGKARWEKYERATVLFSDIQGFTKIAEEMNPESLIDELDQFFFHFDSVVEKYNIEKIKTIGDAYMAAGGIPEKNSTNPVEVVLAALEMQAYMQQLKSSKVDIWDLRIGIHTGPVIAGVVGHKKMSYDIWGDTVNTASRMESSGKPGKINISGITYGMVKDYFICEYRGKIPVKYKGNIDMYFVNGLRPELAVDLKGIPNRRFFFQLQILRLRDLEDRVFEEILKDLPDYLHFHNLEYSQKIYNHSFLLCRAEEVEQDDRLLVRTAALMLYTGLTHTYSNFENRSAVIARDILPEYHYSEDQVDKICNLILSTKQPFEPNNNLEKILIDASMEFLGQPDYTKNIKLLYQELKETGSGLNGQQFKNQQLELLFSFDYFTVAAKRLREVSGEKQMRALESERWI